MPGRTESVSKQPTSLRQKIGKKSTTSYVTSDAIKIEPNAVVKHYCVWFDFYCIRRYMKLVSSMYLHIC